LSSSASSPGDLVLETVAVPSLPPGGTFAIARNVAIPATAPAGATVYLWAWADVNGTAGQSNRDNDKASVPFSVAAAPKSAPARRGLPPRPPSGPPGSSSPVSCVAAPQGPHSFPPRRSSDLLSSSASSPGDLVLETVAVPSLPPGGTFAIARNVA